MNLTKLKKLAEDLTYALDNIDYIFDTNRNCGGCGFIAICLFSVMPKKFNPKIRVLQSCYGGYSTEWITNIDIGDFIKKKRVKNLRDLCYKHDLSFSHVVVEIQVGKRTYYIDGDGLHSGRQLRENWNNTSFFTGELSLKVMKKMWDSEEGWNDVFDRAACLDIEQVIQETFAECT